MAQAALRKFPQAAPTLQRDPDLEDCVRLEGLTWGELVSTAGLEAVIRAQESGDAIADRVERRRYYAYVARKTQERLALLNGKQPRGWNRRAVCAHCGPVWLSGEGEPGIPWMRVERCHCCKLKPPPQGFARPLVSCLECKHFESSVDPVIGRPMPWGRCTALGKNASITKPIYCRDFEKRAEEPAAEDNAPQDAGTPC